MKEYQTDQIRNVVMLGHGGTGTTSLSEAALFAARAQMQAGYLAQIEREFAFPKGRMALLADEIKGAEKLRQVGRIFFDGVDLTPNPSPGRRGESPIGSPLPSGEG